MSQPPRIYFDDLGESALPVFDRWDPRTEIFRKATQTGWVPLLEAENTPTMRLDLLAHSSLHAAQRRVERLIQAAWLAGLSSIFFVSKKHWGVWDIGGLASIAEGDPFEGMIQTPPSWLATASITDPPCPDELRVSVWDLLRERL